MTAGRRNGARPSDALEDEDQRRAMVGALYQTYHQALLRRMRARQVGEQDSEDIVQEVFIQALRDIGFYDRDRSAPGTWLSHLADQALAKHHRRHDRSQSAEASPNDIEAPAGLDPAEKEEIRHLMLDHLTPLNYRLVASRYLLGATTGEIAREMGLQEVAVRQRLSRSLARLRAAAAGWPAETEKA